MQYKRCLKTPKLRLGTNVELNSDELKFMTRSKFVSISSTGCIWIDRDVLSVWSRRKERLKIDSGSNVDLFMSRTKCIIFIIKKIGIFQPRSQLVCNRACAVIGSTMAAFRANSYSRYSINRARFC